MTGHLEVTISSLRYLNRPRLLVLGLKTLLGWPSVKQKQGKTNALWKALSCCCDTNKVELCPCDNAYCLFSRYGARP